jgi:hypothetical protein
MEGWIMSDIRTSKLGGIPFGDNSGRPVPSSGQPYFNGETSRLELYTANGWQNIVQETPSVVSISGYAKENATSNITLNGSNFATGAIAYAIASNGNEYQANTTTLVSIVQITANFPALPAAYEPYDIKLINPSNQYGILYDCLTVDNLPIWTTASGSLGTYIEQAAISVTVAATDEPDSGSSALVYSVSSGSLPSGLTLNSTTGVISGTPIDIVSNTTYTFAISVSDGASSVPRTFSITISDRGPAWTTGSVLPTFTLSSAYSTTLVATDDSEVAPTYSLFSGTLPTGLSLSSGGVISGTPTSSSPATFTVRATDNGGNYIDRQFTIANVGPTWTTSGPITDGSANTAYSYQLIASDDSGVAPTYALASGSLPTGITLSSSGLLSGTPTTVGQQGSIIVSATDANGVSVNSSSITFGILSGISATGGTSTTSGAYRYHTFTGSGSFQVTNFPAGSYVDVLVVAGGGAGGNDLAGGGGAGGVIYRANWEIGTGSSTVTIGGGGNDQSISGNNSSFGAMTGFGGGRGANWNPQDSGKNGGSGGGGGGRSWTSPGSATQTSNNGGTGYGNAGGSGNSAGNGPGGGGGGAGAAGGSSASSLTQAGNGGVGLNSWSSWTPVTALGQSGYIAGGGGGADDGGGATVGSGGLGGGASGVSSGGGASGVANTGGGGGASNNYPGGSGGSGIVIVRYFA